MTEAQLKSIDTLDEANKELDLADIKTYEVRGRRRDGGFDDMENDDSTDGPTAPIEILIRDGDEAFTVRLRLEQSAPKGTVHVDLAGIFRKVTPGRKLSTEVQQEFISTTAIAALYPYLRQAVSDVAGRLGFKLLLGLLDVQSVGEPRLTGHEA